MDSLLPESQEVSPWWSEFFESRSPLIERADDFLKNSTQFQTIEEVQAHFAQLDDEDVERSLGKGWSDGGWQRKRLRDEIGENRSSWIEVSEAFRQDGLEGDAERLRFLGIDMSGNKKEIGEDYFKVAQKCFDDKEYDSSRNLLDSAIRLHSPRMFAYHPWKSEKFCETVEEKKNCHEKAMRSVLPYSHFRKSRSAETLPSGIDRLAVVEIEQSYARIPGLEKQEVRDAIHRAISTLWPQYNRKLPFPMQRIPVEYAARIAQCKLTEGEVLGNDRNNGQTAISSLRDAMHAIKGGRAYDPRGELQAKDIPNPNNRLLAARILNAFGDVLNACGQSGNGKPSYENGLRVLGYDPKKMLAAPATFPVAAEHHSEVERAVKGLNASRQAPAAEEKEDWERDPLPDSILPPPARTFRSAGR